MQHEQTHMHPVPGGPRDPVVRKCSRLLLFHAKVGGGSEGGGVARRR